MATQIEVVTPPDKFHTETADVTFEFRPNNPLDVLSTSRYWIGRFHVQIPKVGDSFPGYHNVATIHFQNQTVELDKGSYVATQIKIVTPPDEFHAKVADVVFEFRPAGPNDTSNGTKHWIGRLFFQIPQIGDNFPIYGNTETIHFEDQSVELSHDEGSYVATQIKDVTPYHKFQYEVADVFFEFKPASSEASNGIEHWVGRFYVQIPKVGESFPSPNNPVTISLHGNPIELTHHENP